jgi:hypothetical protein
MNSIVSNAAWKPSNRRRLAIAGGLWLLILASAGLLALCSCASTPKGVEREQALYLCASNGLVSAHEITPYLPAPANSVWEGFLAVAGAGLAVWASHLHRSVAELKKNGNGNGSTASAAPPAAPGPGAPGPKA